MTKSNNLVSIGEEYLKSWEHHDLKAMGECLHPSLHFKEPLSEITNRQPFLAFAEKNLHFVREVKIQSRFGSENEAAFIYDFVFIDPIGTCKTAAHLIFEDGKIRCMELFYDPRHLEKMMTGRNNSEGVAHA